MKRIVSLALLCTLHLSLNGSENSTVAGAHDDVKKSGIKNLVGLLSDHITEVPRDPYRPYLWEASSKGSITKNGISAPDRSEISYLIRAQQNVANNTIETTISFTCPDFETLKAVLDTLKNKN